jgi:hypothetical protein
MFSNDLLSVNVFGEGDGLLLLFLWRIGQRLFDGAFVCLERVSWGLVLLPSLPTIQEGVFDFDYDDGYSELEMTFLIAESLSRS